MIVYKCRRFAARRYQYGGSGIVSTIGSLLARYATKAMLATAAKAALKGSLKAAKRAVPHLIAHKIASTIVDAAKKRKRVDINVKSSQEPQSKKAFLDTGPNKRIWYCIGLKMIGESILELHETNAIDESIKSYEYNEYQPITDTT